VSDTARDMHGRPDGRRRAAEAAVIALAVIGVIIALVLGRDVFVPLTLSIVIATALQPLVRRLERLHVPAVAGAIIVVLTMLAIIGLVGVALEEPIRDLASEVPKSVAVARQKLEPLAQRIRRITSAGGGAPTAPPRPDSAGQKPAPGTSQTSPSRPTRSSGGGAQAAAAGAAGAVFGATTSLIVEVVEEVLLVFFMLAAGKGWMKKLARMARSPERKTLLPEIAGEMHDVVSRYLFVTLLINIGQAIVIGLATWALGMPTPFLWAVLTFLAEWIPYLGGLIMVVLLLIVGLTTKQSFAYALLAPTIYLLVTTLQNNLVSPVAYGRGLRLNPTAILFAVMFWFMLWGVAGAFLAVPIVASLRVLASRMPALEPVAILLEE
jgi:predicted PurR-regulated permease PerM